MIRVRRHFEVNVSYTDEHGAQSVMKASGDLSELLQHEIDHLTEFSPPTARLTGAA